jgi:hypothetical protein
MNQSKTRKSLKQTEKSAGNTGKKKEYAWRLPSVHLYSCGEMILKFALGGSPAGENDPRKV